jgi:threonine dehydrogenase-like Zn-dependent dehydrogenase
MKTALLDGKETLTIVDDWPEPDCGDNDVIVSMRAVAICGSDLSQYAAGTEKFALGHEGCGVITTVGRNVDDRRLGERVVIEPNIPCGKCPACHGGRTSGCPNRQIIGGTLPGLLRERAVVPGTSAHRIPDSITDAQGACIEPLTVARAAARRADVPAGERCLVIGAGSQGLLLSMFLKAGGAIPVVTDIHDGRLAVAEELGAQILSGDEKFGHIFETSGAAPALVNAVDHSAAFTQITLLGISDAPLALSMKTIVRRQLRILGSLIYDHPTDFLATIALVAQGQVNPQHAIKAQYGFKDVAAAFAAARQVPGKTVIHFDDVAATGS